MYSNNIVNFQESTTILNAHTKKVWKLIVCTSYHYYYLQDFPTSVSWWSFTGVWVTGRILRSPGLFSVFWLISAIQWMESIRPVIYILSLCQAFWDYFKRTNYKLYPWNPHVPHLFLVLWQGPHICFSFLFLLLHCDPQEWQNLFTARYPFFC